jgi:hypothetical protein
MSLKFPFKFKYYRDGVEIYTADFGGKLGVKVSFDNFCVGYYLEEVLYNVENGYWRILPEYEADPMIELRQSEYNNLIEEINLLQELLAEVFTVQPVEQFKPVKDMTFEDWEQAEREGWVFELRCGDYSKVEQLSHKSALWKVCTKFGWVRVDGSFQIDYEEHDYDIIKRIS